MNDDLQLPTETDEPISVEQLADDVRVLRQRITRLESLTGYVNEDTVADLPDEQALSLLGGAGDRLEQMRADAKGRRAQMRMGEN